MRVNQLPGKNAKDRMAVSVRNNDTVAIPAGTPVVFAMNGTNDGLDVVLPTSVVASFGAAAQIQGFRVGVTFKTLQIGDYGEAVCFGYTNTLILIRQTRTSSSAVWVSEPARSIGEYLTIVTVSSAANNAFTNGFSTCASTFLAASASSAAAAGTIVIPSPDAVLAQTLPTYVSSASTTADSRTAITVAVKAFIRMM